MDRLGISGIQGDFWEDFDVSRAVLKVDRREMHSLGRRLEQLLDCTWRSQ